ncbi:hypothetical protein SLS53_002192 [Cytospora paraplurivora]|uniref:Uncharacterized protein n=1 Tax=Cytospora paraplurivora TaxID=2898453 RepID=A0AAN9UL37_9PEZI
MSSLLSILASLAFYVPSTILFLAVFWLAVAESDDAPAHEMPGALKDDEAEDFSLHPPTPSFSSSSSLPSAQPASPPTGCATTSLPLPPPSVSSRDLPSPPSPILPASETSHMVRGSRFVEHANGEVVRKAWQDNKLTFEAVEAVLLGKLSLSEAIVRSAKALAAPGLKSISDDDADDGLHTCIEIKPKSSSPEKKNQVTLVRPIEEKLVEDEVDVDGSFVEAFARLQIADEASPVLQPAADDITALIADTLETLERLEALTSFDTSLVPYHPDPHQPAPLQQVLDDTYTVAEAFESHPVIPPPVPQHPVVLPSWVAKLPVGPPASVAFAQVLPCQFSVLGGLKATKKRPSNTRPARHHPYQRSSSRKSVLAVRPRGKFIAKKKGSLSPEPFELAASVAGDLLDVNTPPYHQEPAPPVMVAQPPQVDDIVSDVVVVSEPAPLAIEVEEVVPEQVLTPAPQAIEAQPLKVDVVVSDVVAEPEQIVTPAPVQPPQPEPAPLVKEAQPTIFDGFKFDVVGVPALSFDPTPVPQFTELVFAPIPVPQLPVPEPAAEAPAALPSPADKEMESVAPAPIPQPPQPTPDLPALPALSSQKALPPPESVESIIERASQQLPPVPAPAPATTPVPAPSPAAAPAEAEVSDLDLEMALAEERAEAAKIAAQADIAAAQEAVRQHDASVPDPEPESEPEPEPTPTPAPAPAPAPTVALRDFTEHDLELALADELWEKSVNLAQADIAAAKEAVEQHNASEATDEPAPAGPAEEKKKEEKKEKAADPLMAALDALEAEEEAEKAKSRRVA